MKRHKVYRKKIILITLLILFTISACSRKKEFAKSKVVLAKVNDDIITLEEFQKRFDEIKSSYDPVALKLNKDLDIIKKSLLNKMITSVILNQEAWKINITVSEDEMKSYIEDIRGNFTAEQFRQTIIRKNINYEAWKNEQKNNLILKKLTNVISKETETSVSEKEIKDYYSENIEKFKQNAQVRVAQIVVESNVIASDILLKLKRGANFTQMAKEHSLSPDKDDGGDIGYFEKGKKIPEFDVAFNLNVGQISSVIKSHYGYHILKVLGKKPARTLSLTEVRENIKKEILGLKKEEVYRKWLEKKISEASIFQNNEVLKIIH